MKLFRCITQSYPKLKYKTVKNASPEELQLIKEEQLISFKSCHWGQYKLFYTEFEFLELVAHHLNLSECLILYVGAANGSHLNLLLEFYPDINLLLYDPNKFEIKESKNVKIYTNQDGFFDDSKIPQVLEYANGKKILFISDIRLTDEDEYTRQKVIYNDMIIQQKWAISLQSEFMLFKFRMFYYTNDPTEVDFIDNSYVNSEFYKVNCIIEQKSDIKYDDVLYLNGSIYTQLYNPIRSGETRLFVSKLKYKPDSKKYKPEDLEKYSMKYYNNLDYEYQLNYFNIHDRNKPYVWGKSNILAKYIPGMEINYTSACEYYLIYKYLKHFNKSYKFDNVLLTLIKILTFMNTYHHNNLVVCQYKHFSKNITKIKTAKELMGNNRIINFDEYINELNQNKKKRFVEQVHNLRSLKHIDQDIIEKFIISYNFNNQLININNGKITFKNYT